MVAISPDGPAKVKELEGKTGTDLKLLSDPQLSASTALGLVFSLSEETAKRYGDYGIPLVKLEGQDRPLLPVPAIYIVGQDGRVRFQYVDPDFRQRIDPQLLLAAAKASKS